MCLEVRRLHQLVGLPDSLLSATRGQPAWRPQGCQEEEACERALCPVLLVAQYEGGSLRRADGLWNTEVLMVLLKCLSSVGWWCESQVCGVGDSREEGREEKASIVKGSREMGVSQGGGCREINSVTCGEEQEWCGDEEERGFRGRFFFSSS